MYFEVLMVIYLRFNICNISTLLTWILQLFWKLNRGCGNYYPLVEFLIWFLTSDHEAAFVSCPEGIIKSLTHVHMALPQVQCSFNLSALLFVRNLMFRVWRTKLAICICFHFTSLYKEQYRWSGAYTVCWVFGCLSPAWDAYLIQSLSVNQLYHGSTSQTNTKPV